MIIKKTTLQSLIQRNFLISALVPILIIELFLIILYFSINTYISYQNQKVLSDEVLSELQKITYREAHELNQILREVSRTTLFLQSEHQRFFQDQEHCHLPNGEPSFGVHPNGSYYKLENNGGASLYYAATTALGKKEKAKARCSERLDPFLKQLVDINPLVTQAYFNSYDDMNRLYPFMADAPAQYGPSIHMKDYNFYFLADAEHNPEKGSVWTDAYLDPAGQGWMVSVMAPIYNQGFLEGVSGVDVTIDTIVNNILNVELPWQSAAFLVDNEGIILAMPEKIERLLSLNELTTHDYQKVITQTVKKPQVFNILNISDKRLGSQFKHMMEAEHSQHHIQINDQSYVFNNFPVNETGWQLFIIVDKENFLAPIKKLATLIEKIGCYALIAIVIFYMLFFLHLSRRSKDIAKTISSPIEELSIQTSMLGKHFEVTLKENTGIVEIDKLTENFNTMSRELDHRSTALVEEKVRKQLIERERKVFEDLATHDRLTNLYNRHKIDKILENELKRTQRYHRGLGLIIVDLDFFKEVNDNYGHAVGDQVLISLSEILLNQSRNTDYVGRWGGEEFVVISPEVDISMTLIIAEKLRQAIENIDFDKVGNITASLGVTVYQEGDTADSLFVRADQALYQAKHSGRNCCKIS